MRLARFVCTDCGAESPAVRVVEAHLVRGSHDCGTTCTGCGWRKGRRNLRGLCVTCYADPEARMDAPLQIMRGDDLMDEWDFLRREGYTVRQAADRIGITFAALDRALCRAKRRGDPRAIRSGVRTEGVTA